MKNHNNKSYYYLVAMTVLSFVCMYILMYAMVDRFVNVYPNLNQFYMAGLMTLPMIIIEMLFMRVMYGNKKLNIAIIIMSILLLVIFWIFIRQQYLIGDKQFLKSMIPHHAGAILMCEKATIQNFEVKKLCENIKLSQQNEINQMKDILKKLED